MKLKVQGYSKLATGKLNNKSKKKRKKKRRNERWEKSQIEYVKERISKV